ncbi:MAG TPA: hypothetical protein VEK38_02585 [Candidatus Bathyarchaeia archaeon]|nr:hypothetical protein [Candidatus Bathyarchaeia archaeon]
MKKNIVLCALITLAVMPCMIKTFDYNGLLKKGPLGKLGFKKVSDVVNPPHVEADYYAEGWLYVPDYNDRVYITVQAHKENGGRYKIEYVDPNNTFKKQNRNVRMRLPKGLFSWQNENEAIKNNPTGRQYQLKIGTREYFNRTTGQWHPSGKNLHPSGRVADAFGENSNTWKRR